MVDVRSSCVMPHAVPLERLPLDFYSPARTSCSSSSYSSSSFSSSSAKYHHQQRQQQQQPPARSMQLPVPTTSSGATLTLPRNPPALPLTPPAEMTNMNAGFKLVPFQGSNGGTAPLGYPLPSIGGSRAGSEEDESPCRQRAPVAATSVGHRRKNSISPNLKVPPTIKAPQEGLPQLAAEITYLFWFENSPVLKAVLEADHSYMPSQPLSPDVIPTTGFRKWVTTILSTTQVAPNVIILALLFIFRLKQINPSVKGKPGSEYRLLTVALMLGNKFLDDNTYTNKTWAEVSGISVQEVHIMEVEFLSNMRYSLFTSQEKWEEWHGILGKFGTFFDRASKLMHPAPVGSPSSLAPYHSPPKSQYYSPPAAVSGPSLQTYLPPPATAPPTMFGPASMMDGPTTHAPPLGPLTQRKRSADFTAEQPAKRLAHTFVPGVYSGAMAIPSVQVPVGQPGQRLPPLPALSIPPPQYSTAPVQMPPGSALPPVTSPYPPISLPQTSRSMASVYSPAPTNWNHHLYTTPTSTSAPQFPPPVSASPAEGSRALSPFLPGSGNASPVSATLTSSNRQLSPSYFLAQRQSPYRPVRGVSTLLVPPPPASLRNPASQVGFEQMQYHPLGRPMGERRVGTLPPYLEYPFGDSNPPPPQPNFRV